MKFCSFSLNIESSARHDVLNKLQIPRYLRDLPRYLPELTEFLRDYPEVIELHSGSYGNFTVHPGVGAEICRQEIGGYKYDSFETLFNYFWKPVEEFSVLVAGQLQEYDRRISILNRTEDKLIALPKDYKVERMDLLRIFRNVIHFERLLMILWRDELAEPLDQVQSHFSFGGS
jgi:hypothetical protein